MYYKNLNWNFFILNEEPVNVGLCFDFKSWKNIPWNMYYSTFIILPKICI